MKSDFEINKETIIADVLREHPECIEVFEKHGLPCRTCMGVDSDTVEGGAAMHDLDADTILRELRECASRKRE